MGVRQTFGLFSGDFEIDCGISNTEFGLAIALHALIWGIVVPSLEDSRTSTVEVKWLYLL